tara:strand:- start:4019 stop:5605 length:1587 start_codon:yes stop_codon:yes gene_type:complete
MSCDISRTKHLVFNEKTPLDVILFLLRTTGKDIERDKLEKKMDKVIIFLKDYTFSFVEKSEYTEEEICKMTSFITDREEPWSVENLVSSIKNFLSFQSIPTLEIEETGSRTNTKPYSFDISMLYRLCLELSLPTEKEDTLEILYQKVSGVRSNKKKLLDDIKNKLLYYNDFQLIKINSFEIKKKKYVLDVENIETLSKKINMGYIINNSILSSEEAIIYASKFFNTDITNSENPDTLLRFLSKGEVENYTFEDKFSKINKINPKYYKLDKFWKPKKKVLYTPKSLQLLKKYCEVATEEELTSSLEINTFYEGYLDFDKYSQFEEDILSYGNFKDNVFESISVKDLTQKFKEELIFGKYQNTIPKLLNIATDNTYGSLENIILYIQKYCDIITSSILYCRKNKEEKLEKFFEQLSELSEILKEKQEINDLDNLSFINSLEELIKTFNSIGNEDYKREIEKLPILNYKTGKFAKANENYYEYLIEDLKSLKNIKGKSEEFIKMKFQQYSYTSYYYSYLFFEKRLFKIEVD